MEKGGEANHIDIRMAVQETAETLQGMGSCLWLAHIKGDLGLYVLPVVYHCVVHMYRVPHNICQEAYGVLMEKLRRGDYHISGLFVVGPAGYRHCFACGAVYNFPPSCNVVTGVDLQHIRVKVIHQVNFQCLRNCGVEGAHNVHLLDLVRVGFCPGVVFSCGVVSGVDLRSGVLQFLGKFRSVAVTDGVCAPLVHNIQCLFYHIQVCWYGNTSFFCFHFRYLRCCKILSSFSAFAAAQLPIISILRIRVSQADFNGGLALLFRNLAVFFVL